MVVGMTKHTETTTSSKNDEAAATAATTITTTATALSSVTEKPTENSSSTRSSSSNGCHDYDYNIHNLHNNHHHHHNCHDNDYDNDDDEADEDDDFSLQSEMSIVFDTAEGSNSNSSRNNNNNNNNDTEKSIRTRSRGRNNNNNNNNNNTKNKTKAETFTAQETEALRAIKICFIISLFVSMAIVGYNVYAYIQNQEYSMFESQFEEDAKKVLGTLGKNLDHILEGMDAFSISMVSYARATNQSWPFVVIPDFAVRAEKTRAVSNALYLNTFHYIQNDDEQRQQWEQFTSLPENNYWINETIALQEADPNNVWPIVWNYTNVNVIHGREDELSNNNQEAGNGDNSSGGPWLPAWQIMPAIPFSPLYNWDLLSQQQQRGDKGETSITTLPSSSSSSVEAVFKTHKVVIKEAYLIHTEDLDPETIERNAKQAERLSHYLETDEDPLEPISDYYYPVIDNSIDQLNLFLDDETNNNDDENGNNNHYDMAKNNIVAIMSMSIYWRDTLKDILSDNSRGVVVVFENECNPSFTYQIDGADVKFLGGGDRHDEDYDGLVQSSWLYELRKFSTTSSSSSRSNSRNNNKNKRQAYSGRPLNEEYCPFHVSVYPSDINKELYTSNNPVIFAITAMAIFLFTSLAFILYDCYVEHRHDLIQHKAVKSKTIFESLFPAFVREGVEEEAMPAVSSVAETPKKRLISFLNDSSVRYSAFHAYNRRGSPGERNAPYFAAGSNCKKNGPGGVIHEDDDNEMDYPSHPFSADTTTGGTTTAAAAAVTGRGKPIAELFPHTTVMFADIAGFTAWASVRDPSQVFALLESVYGAFDRIASRRKVFKVETIGDCYVAVCGLPEPNERHEINMSNFAHDCREKMKIVTRALETTLGPGTGDLCLRIGLHSGPTTAGVLRGQKARFQLFGDTVNTAARMESTGIPNFIQVSQKTANLLIQHGKSHWLRARPDLVSAKGKGLLQTYFVEPRKKNGGGGGSNLSTKSPSVASAVSSTDAVDNESQMLDGDHMVSFYDEKDDATGTSTATLIDWNTYLFEGLLRDIIRSREKTQRKSNNINNSSSKNKKNRSLSSSNHNNHNNNKNENKKTDDANLVAQVEKQLSKGGGAEDDSTTTRVRDEVAEVIIMAEFNPNAIQTTDDELEPPSPLTAEVRWQLRSYVETISGYYPNNPFHNFEHASHVMMSVIKLLQRISTREVKKTEVLTKRSYYDYTYGIASDPLTKFAVAFSALIHDVDHQGVPNGQLVKEDTALARFYNNKSVAEQNSIDVAWNLLMEDSFKDLRAAIYTTPEELQRFRQLVVNCVIATDIFDKELKALRDGRWEKAFSPSSSASSMGNNDSRHGGSSMISAKLDQSSFSNTSATTSSRSIGKCDNSVHDNDNNNNNTTTTTNNNNSWNCKATIVIEHIIQASDVAHTMQHWHIYQKWNAQLFKECYTAYKNGRSEKDPSEGWYEGELWFFDNYIIPLAKKLKECEVFGVSCDEFLDFANENRKEWAVKGRAIVAELKAKNEKEVAAIIIPSSLEVVEC